MLSSSLRILTTRRQLPALFADLAAPAARRRSFALTPATMAPTTLAVACTPADLKDGQMKEVDFGEGKVLLSRVAGELYATSSQCTHYGAPLVKGVLSGSGRVTCPWHGACFSVKTGDIEDAPGLDSLHKYAVEPTEGEHDQIRITADLDVIKAKKGRLPCADRARVRKHTREGAVKGAEEHVVIIGGGSAGAGAIEGLRELDYKGKITLLSSEPHPPIDRTKLSKALITDAGKIALRPLETYTSAPFNIDLRVSTLVESVDLAAKTLQIEGGGQEAWDKLIVATGASPRDLPVDGKDLGGIHKLRTIEHAKAIDAELQEGKKLVLVGSSFISMELAVLATNKKLASITVIGMETVPFERVLGKEVGAGFLKGLTVKGIDFEMQAGVDSFVPSKDDSSRVGGVKLKSGVVLDADVVVLGTGAAPNTQLLEQAGVALEDDRSVKVNGFLQLDGHPDVYALGDIATYPFRGTSTRIEHWNVAANHGRAAAAHIAGDEAAKHPFDKTPIFWSALGSQLRYSGNGKGFAEVHVDGEPSEFKFAAYYADEAGEVIASASMGRDPLNSQVAELLWLGKMPTLAEIKDGKSPLEIELSAV